jgi:hypothetical protein
MIPDLVQAAAADDYDAVGELEKLAAADPARLAPYLAELLYHDVLWPPTLFRAADRDVVTKVVDRIDAGTSSSHDLARLLLILAHTRDAVAEAALRRWQNLPPVGMGNLHLSPLDYAKQGGWTVHKGGARRELCGSVAYELLMRPAPQTAAGEVCPWCASPLWTALDLDTGHAEVGRALAHTQWSGRLRIMTCFLCVNFTPLYTAVTPDGGAAWSAHNRRPDYLECSTEEPPELLPVVGAQRATPYLASAWDEGGSTLGGVPNWIQDAEYVDCGACGQPMDYIGLLGLADLGWNEGADYLFLHAPCGLAAVCYQQS